jgi:uncharacterized protein
MQQSNTLPSPQLHPFLGFGLGLRKEHYPDILAHTPNVNWFEILTENYLIPGGKPLYYLDQIVERYPVVMHGVSMSIGSVDPVDVTYLKQVKALADRVDAKWVSDHLCWTGVDGTNMHDLLPLPYTEEAIEHVANKVKQAQDIIERPLLLENVSSYISYQESVMSESEFFQRVVERANCLMLLDINNIFVSSFNHGFDAVKYLDDIPKERVQQFHLAGHLNLGDHIIDTHDHDVIDDVWQLYNEALKRFGPVSTMIERDAHIPPLNDLLKELEQAKQIAFDVIPKEALVIHEST